MTSKRALAVALAAFALLLSGAYISTGKRNLVTNNTSDWIDKHYAELTGSSTLPPDCDATPSCYGGGAYTNPEAALQAAADDLALACSQYPQAAIQLDFVHGPPGSDNVRENIYFKGLVDELLARGIRCRLQVETRGIDVVQFGARPTLTTNPRYSGSARGCEHGTLSHWHRNDADPDNECGFPRVGLCAGGAHAGNWCRCTGTDGQLDTDGTCQEELDAEDCPDSTCVVEDWDGDWFLTGTDAEVAAEMSGYAQTKTTHRQRDAWCDDLPNRIGESDCDGADDPSVEQYVPAGRRGRPYIYRELYGFDYGASQMSLGGGDNFSGPDVPRTVSSSTATTVTVSSATWTPDQWAGGKVYIRFTAESTTWEVRDVVSNNDTTLTVSSAWTTNPTPGTLIGITAAGNTPSIRAEISGVVLDVDNAALRNHMAAISFALAYDLGIPPSQPLILGSSTKFGWATIAPPDGHGILAPCRTPQNAFFGINRFDVPAGLGRGDGKCAITSSHYGPGWHPWPAVGQYETAWNAYARRILDQIPTSYYPQAKLSSVAAPRRNEYGTTIGGQGLWEGLSISVHDDPRYAGSRYNTISPTASFPFVVYQCSNGVDDDGDGDIDNGVDDGCSSSTDNSEARCGDAFVDPGEGCDDGNGTQTDACLNSCVAATCGDGYVRSGVEDCDDGNTTDGDGCAGDCLTAVSSLTVDFAATPLQGTTCVAPCAVHFDAIGDGSNLTTDGDFAREFHTHKFRWDFGDPGSGTWGRGANPTASRNAGEGAIQGHLYETPGTYTASLTVTAPDGETDTVSHSITVTNPDTQFSGTNTICVGNSLPTAGAGGCPSGAAVVSNSDLDDALSDSTTGDGGGVNGGCNADGAKVRCLFKGGDTFTASANVTLYGGTSGPGIIGSYGTGPALMLSNNAGGNGATTISLALGWKITPLEMTNRNINDTTSPFVLPGNSTSTAGVEIIGVTCLNLANYCASTAGGDSGSPYNAALIDNVTESDSALGDADPGGFFLRHNNLLVMGNDFGGPAPDYFVRTVHQSKYLNAHNNYTNDNPIDQNSIQVRSCAGSGCGGNNTIQQSRWIIIADNLFDQRNPGSGGSTIMLWDNSASTTGTTGGGMSDVIVERNFQRWLTSETPVGAAGIVGFHPQQDVTVRNNVLDLQGSATSAGSRFSIVNFMQPTGLTAPSGIEVYNNTAYTDDTGSRAFYACVGSANIAAGKCYGNMIYAPNESGAFDAADGGNWTTADNVRATTQPFIAAPPQQGATRISDFVVNVGSQADGAGYDFAGTDTFNQLDAGGCGRSAPWDAGAWQIGATGCLETESLIGINSEKMLAAEEAIIFADAVDNHPVLRHTADPATSREESFFRSYRTNLSTLESGITIPTNNLGWPTVDLPYDNDGGGANPSVVARMDLMTQTSLRPIAYPTGSYTLQFDGTGEVRLTGDGTVTCTGTDRSCAVSITPTTSGVSLWITESDTGNIGDPITDVRLLLPGYTASDTFYWPSVVRLRPFGFIRSLNFTRANDYECSNLATGEPQSRDPDCTHTWATRTQPTGIQASRKGISWEKQHALAEAAQVDFWPVIPHGATDDYLTQYFTLAKATSIGKILAELSNETWNPGFAQEEWFGETGALFGWGTGTGGNTANQASQQRAYVERAADMADIADGIFTGADATRLVKVLGSARGTGDTAALITALGSGTYNPTGATFDAVAINTYWAGGCTGGTCTAGTCVGGTEDGEACTNTVTWFLDDAETEIAAMETTIDSEYASISAAGMEMYAYEGGPLMPGSDSVSIDANDDARMEGISEDAFTLWFANGGSLTGAGFWMRDAENGGILRYPTQAAPPRWLGTLNAIDAAALPQ